MSTPELCEIFALSANLNQLAVKRIDPPPDSGSMDIWSFQWVPRLILWSPSRLVGPNGAKGMQITTEQAERVLKASILKAHELGISVCIAILNSGGHLKTFHRMDGAWPGVIDVAIKKRRYRLCLKWKRRPLTTTAKQGQTHMELSSPMVTS
jgi:heme-degrading protein